MVKGKQYSYNLMWKDLFALLNIMCLVTIFLEKKNKAPLILKKKQKGKLCKAMFLLLKVTLL